jgi:hypothetical protein
VLLTDVDGDGNGDLVVVYYDANFNPVGAGPVAPNDVYIWWGNGDGTFNQTPLVLDLSRNYYLGAVADMNGDGLPDLVLSDGSLVSILYNQGSRSFGSINPNTGEYTGEQHFLAGQGINSLSVARLSAGSLPDLIVANGGATISNAFALGGATASSLSLPVNPDVNTGGITVLVNNISTVPVTGTLVASPEPSNFGATFTLTATLTPVTGTTAPMGQVTFSIDGVVVPCSPGTLTPTGGTSLSSSATCVIPAGNTYASGVHPISATYSGSSVYTATVLSGSHTITGRTTPPMIESLTATPEPSVFGAGFTLGAALTPVPGVPEPTGVVTFFIDGVQVGTGNLAPVLGSSSSSASFSIPVGNVYPVGSHALSANYSGDTANSPITFFGTHGITGTTTTTIYLCVSPNPGCPYLGPVPTTPPYVPSLTMYYGQGWNGTWSVSASDNGPVPGNFQLYDLYNGVSTLLCNVSNISGAACPPAVGVTQGTSVGINVLTGVYTGDTTHAPSTSLPVTITVLQDTTSSAALTGAPNPSPAGQPVTFSATLSGNDAAPTGTVVFSQVNTATGIATPIGTGNLYAGVRLHQHRNLHHIGAAHRERLHHGELRRDHGLRRRHLPHHHRDHHSVAGGQLHGYGDAKSGERRRWAGHAPVGDSDTAERILAGCEPDLQQPAQRGVLHLRQPGDPGRRRRDHADRGNYGAPHLRHHRALLLWRHGQGPAGSAVRAAGAGRTDAAHRSRKAPLAARTGGRGGGCGGHADLGMRHVYRPGHAPSHIHLPGDGNSGQLIHGDDADGHDECDDLGVGCGLSAIWWTICYKLFTSSGWFRSNQRVTSCCSSCATLIACSSSCSEVLPAES